MKKFAISILTLTIFVSIFLSGCAEEEPRHKNMPVSVFIKNVVTSQNERTIDQSIDALISIGGPAVPYIQKAWKKNDDATVRCRFCYVIEGIGPAASSMVPYLIKALDEIEEQRISCAALALGGIGEASAPASAKLGQLLRSSDTLTQSNILYALGSIGSEAADQIPLVMEAVDRDKTREIAIQALSGMGLEAVKAVEGWLESGDNDQRLAACQVLSEAGEEVAAVLPGLTKALKDKSPNVRLAAVKAIAQAGPLALPVEDDLIAALADKNDNVHREAINALGKLGFESTPKLVKALDSRNSRTREGAARAIGRYTDRIEVAKPKLLTLLSDSNVNVRLAVIDALTNSGPSIVPTMIRQLKSSNVIRRFSAARILGNLGDESKDAIPELRKMLNDKDSLLREEAQRALAKIQ